MDSLKRLEELGFDEISKKTQIEIAFFKALVDKDFKTLEHFNVKGFLKIVSRESGLNFDDFLAEYNAFIEENTVEREEKPAVPPRLDAYASHSSKSWLYALILIVIGAIIWAMYYFDLFKIMISDEEQNTSNSSVVEMIDEAQKKLEEVNTSLVPEENNANEEILILQDLNSSENIDTSTLQEQNTTVIELSDKAIFNTSQRIWVGIIDLATRKKREARRTQEFTIDLNKDQLVLIGGGSELQFTDHLGQSTTYPKGLNKRFLIKDQNITKITKEEFMELNGGKEW